MHNDSPTIGTSYSAYRARFLETAGKVGARLQQYQHPLKGLHGETLYTDVATLAEPDTKKWLVSVSGTHGVEGYYGSMCQTVYLEHLQSLAHDSSVGIVMVHLINPWGTSWKRRVNEDNIDLNRNYIDFSQPLPKNPIYETVHDCFGKEAVQADTRPQLDQKWDKKIAEMGRTALMNHVAAGQYLHQDGLYFGGDAPSWSNTTLRTIMNELREHSSDIISFDMHTGAGAYGHPMLMAVAERDYPGLADAERLYGAWLYKVLTGSNQTTDTGISAAATGYTSQAMVDLMHDKRFTQLVIECGTYETDGIGHTALMEDHFQHLRGETSGPEFERIKKNLTEFFFPDDPDWRELVWVRTRQIFDRALTELAERP